MCLWNRPATPGLLETEGGISQGRMSLEGNPWEQHWPELKWPASFNVNLAN